MDDKRSLLKHFLAALAYRAQKALRDAPPVLTLVLLFTGFKVSFTPFKLCPLIFVLSTGFILAGTFIGRYRLSRPSRLGRAVGAFGFRQERISGGA